MERRSEKRGRPHWAARKSITEERGETLVLSLGGLVRQTPGGRECKEQPRVLRTHVSSQGTRGDGGECEVKRGGHWPGHRGRACQAKELRHCSVETGGHRRVLG